MRDWRMRQRYGFGAARVPVPGEPYRPGAPPLGLFAALARARAEIRAEGGRAPGAGLARALPLVLAAWIALVAGLDRWLAPEPESEIAIVPLALEAELAETLPEPPAPIDVAEPTPEPEPEVAPEPEPVVVAEAPPPPEPEPAPEPEVRKPSVQIDAIASAPEPASEPQRRESRRAPDEIAAARTPKPALDRLALPDEPAPSELRSARARPLAVAKRAPALAAPALPSLDVPASDAASAPIRVARNAPRTLPAAAPPRPSLTPVADLAALDARDPAPLERLSRSAPRETRSPATPPRPQLAFADAPLPSREPARPAPSAPVRAARTAASPAPRSSRGNRPSLAPAKLDAGPEPPGSASAAAPRRTARSLAPAGEHTRSATAGRANGLAGVPLGSLRACVTDAREDALKQQVMAAVTTQQECTSDAGRYRFVETKNLNAFLMWIERAPGRREADRCGELSLALECLAQQKRKETRSR
jgi:hypothetical protein